MTRSQEEIDELLNDGYQSLKKAAILEDGEFGDFLNDLCDDLDDRWREERE